MLLFVESQIFNYIKKKKRNRQIIIYYVISKVTKQRSIMYYGSDISWQVIF